MLRTRVLSALAMLPIVAGALYYGDGPFLALSALVLFLAGYEFFRMMAGRDAASFVLGLGGILALTLEAYLYRGRWLGGVLAGLAMASLSWELARPKDGNPSAWPPVMAGLLYIGVLGRHFVLLRALPEGLQWTVLAFLPTWACDSAAYLVGRAFGRHPFLPRVSPKKTWEGAIGGWTAGAIAATLLGYLFGIPIPHGIALGVLLVLGATGGDLAESLLKRRAGVKDAGRLIPGHGGVLDRVDSLLFAVPLVYYYLTLVLGMA